MINIYFAGIQNFVFCKEVHVFKKSTNLAQKLKFYQNLLL